LKQLPRDKDEEKEIARAKKKEGWQTMRGEEGSSDSRYTTTPSASLFAVFARGVLRSLF